MILQQLTAANDGMKTTIQAFVELGLGSYNGAVTDSALIGSHALKHTADMTLSAVLFKTKPKLRFLRIDLFPTS